MSPPIPEPDAGLNAAVAAELRAEMARQRLTVKSLGALADIPYGTLRRYLNAERHIDVAVLEQLAASLDRSAVSIVSSAEDRASSSVAPAIDALRRSALQVYEGGGEVVSEPGDTSTDAVAAHEEEGSIVGEQEESDTP